MQPPDVTRPHGHALPLEGVDGALLRARTIGPLTPPVGSRVSVTVDGEPHLIDR
ncbi:hypothetical protein KC207_15820 [Phycicoccus sp. BSK3Z-2]|uniref:Uncharacterized protein n=1 Tax=Phycicoccus avicenniae TaxID=2828860 RepID=A0A941DC68_9MICO|nr:hypothetical protein [Phycicoccus avicenniae]MBR7744765.1 hypothetical protein [Phycicoccus avicenniae]